MKLVINYDLINAILNVNEPFGPLKIIRNEKKLYLKRLPIYLGMDYLFLRSNPEYILPTLGMQYIYLLTSDVIVEKMIGIDRYATLSSKRLKELVNKLNDLNLETSYDLLLQSSLYDKNYRVDSNETIIPSIVEEKYILVKSYNYHGEIKDTSLLQEHEIGTEDYILSIGSRAKKRKLVRSMA